MREKERGGRKEEEKGKQVDKKEGRQGRNETSVP